MFQNHWGPQPQNQGWAPNQNEFPGYNPGPGFFGGFPGGHQGPAQSPNFHMGPPPPMSSGNSGGMGQVNASFTPPPPMPMNQGQPMGFGGPGMNQGQPMGFGGPQQQFNPWQQQQQPQQFNPWQQQQPQHNPPFPGTGSQQNQRQNNNSSGFPAPANNTNYYPPNNQPQYQNDTPFPQAPNPPASTSTMSAPQTEKSAVYQFLSEQDPDIATQMIKNEMVLNFMPVSGCLELLKQEGVNPSYVESASRWISYLQKFANKNKITPDEYVELRYGDNWAAFEKVRQWVYGETSKILS